MSTTDEAIDALVRQHREMASAGDWGIYPDSRRVINQVFVDDRDWDGLESFYRSAVVRAEPSFDFGELQISGKDFEGFVDKLCAAIRDSLTEAKDCTRALYVEYGQGWCDVFLCSSYSREDDSWAAQYDEDDTVTIEYPEGLLYFSDGESSLMLSLVQRYIDAMLLASIGRCLSSHSSDSSPSLPVGVAASDEEVVRIT